MAQPVDLLAAKERVRTFLEAKAGLDKRFPSTAQPESRVAIIGVYDHKEGRYRDYELLDGDLRTLLDYLENLDG